VLATWVIADDAMLADGLATALFVTDAQRLNCTDRFAFVRMFWDRIERSPGFSGELFV
jgi:FAD:protein FMN transferase